MEKISMSDYSRKDEKICIVKSSSSEGYFGEHIHDFFELFYVINGEGVHILNGEHYPLKSGDLVFLSYNSRHSLYSTSSNFSWINCLFLSEVIDTSLVNSQNAEDILRLSLFTHNFEFKRVHLSDIKIVDTISEFEALFMDMYREYTEAKAGYQEILRHYLLILIFKIFRSLPELQKEKKYKISNNSLVDIVLEEAKNIAFSKNASLENIARKAFVSPKYFSRIFKQETGQTLTDFIHKVRINHACELLETTDMNISEIIRCVGYKDSRFFYKLFLRHTNCTPGEYKSKFNELGSNRN